jgi:Helix-turn-helix of DDE superfamily endonuclease
MTYERMKHLKPGDFKRACGVHPQTFETMLQVLRDHEQKKVKPGRPPTLSLEDQLLMSLQYWREYRTYFHIGLSWGVDESVVCRTVQKIENLLIQSKVFHIPGKKQLRAGGPLFEVIVVDVAESPVERPQKNSGDTIVGRRSAIPRKRRSSSRTRRARSSVSLLARDESTISNCSSAAKSPYR